MTTRYEQHLFRQQRTFGWAEFERSGIHRLAKLARRSHYRDPERRRKPTGSLGRLCPPRKR